MTACGGRQAGGSYRDLCGGCLLEKTCLHGRLLGTMVGLLEALPRQACHGRQVGLRIVVCGHCGVFR